MSQWLSIYTWGYSLYNSLKTYHQDKRKPHEQSLFVSEAFLLVTQEDAAGASCTCQTNDLQSARPLLQGTLDMSMEFRNHNLGPGVACSTGLSYLLWQLLQWIEVGNIQFQAEKQLEFLLWHCGLRIQLQQHRSLQRYGFGPQPSTVG